MKRLVLVGLFCLALTGLTGCAALRAPVADEPTWDMLSANGTKDASLQWQAEARKRFAAPVVVAVHGHVVDGEWYCFPRRGHDPMPVEMLARTMHALYPENDVVLICCNEEGHEIHVPHVWYARSKVWIRPTGAVTPTERYARATSKNVGDIWKFVN